MAQALVEEPPLELERQKFTVDDLDRMVAAGILDDYQVELLEGEFIVVNSMGDPHAWAVRRLTRLLVPAIGDRAWVNVAIPVRSSRYSEPEPDVSIQPAPAPGKSLKLPTPHLVIEVADASLRKDRTLKQRIYSRARVPEYWIVNLVEYEIEVYTEPRGDGYASRVVHPRNATLRIGAFPDVEVPFASILEGLEGI